MAMNSAAGPSGKVVCVTGASGYIASWIVKLLLDRGYTVRATLRDTDDPKKSLHLRALDGAEDRLHLFKANLLEEGSFDVAIDGCDCVFHTASPFYHNFKDPKHWYVLSKTLAEEAAWKFSRDNELEVVTINPSMVIGPLLQPTLNTSAEAILKLIDGSSSTYPNFSFGWVNVTDVALAHILAYEVPSANGRYCIVERVVHCSELVNVIHGIYPTIHLPDKCADDNPSFPTYQVSKEKIRRLGVELIPLEKNIKETIECLKEKGFASFESRNL